MVIASASLVSCAPVVAPESHAFPPVMPELAPCAKDSSAPLHDGVDPAALVMVGYDFGPQCSGTIVELDHSSAYVVSARHCFTDEHGELFLPMQRARVFLARKDEHGSFWDPRPVRGIVKGDAVAEDEWPWERLKLDRGDWIVFTVAREAAMRAVPLADTPLRQKVPAAMLTVRWQQTTGRPCAHARRFAWGDAASLGLAGYSGAAIVAQGRVQGLFVGYETNAASRTSYVRVTPSEAIAKPWRAIRSASGAVAR